MSDRRRILEAVVESAGDAEAAERAGAARLELCVNLPAGGTTPPLALIETVLARVRIPVFVMIRPRAGDFCYSRDELDAAGVAMDAARGRGVHGLVLGVLRPDRTVDIERTRGLVERAAGLPVTFHRAFDATPDRAAALEALIASGIARVLTSGGAATALEGVASLATLVRSAGERLIVLAGGGVRPDNVSAILEQTGVREVHARFEDEARTSQLVDLL